MRNAGLARSSLNPAFFVESNFLLCADCTSKQFEKNVSA